MKIDLFNDDCLHVLKNLPDNSVDSIVTDPPYGLSFMGKKWDYDVPSIEIWEECLRVLKPGGHLLAFSGTRTYHRMVVRIEDAGFEIRDMISWLYGQGFPKSLNVGKAVDSLQGNEREVVEHIFPDGSKPRKIANLKFFDGEENKRAEYTKGNSEWEGWGTALKPSNEPIVMARKPLSEKTVAENVLKWGTGGINIDGCRIDSKPRSTGYKNPGSIGQFDNEWNDRYNSNIRRQNDTSKGRFPANLILSYPEDEYDENGNLLPNPEKDEVLKGFPHTKSGTILPHHVAKESENRSMSGKNYSRTGKTSIGDEGSASRFFYCAKTSKKDRDEGLEGFENKKFQAGNYSQSPVCKTCNKTLNGSNNHNDCSGEVYYRQNNNIIGNHHPTVKPTPLMQYLVKLVTPPNGVCLDPFMGSGSTGKACKLEKFSFIGIEREKEYFDIAKARIDFIKKERKLF